MCSPKLGKFTVFIFLLLTTSFCLNAQQLLKSVPLTTKNIKTAQQFLVGDSIILVYRDAASGSDDFTKSLSNKCIIILPDGKQSLMLLPELYKKDIIAVTDDGANLYFHFIEEIKSKSELKSLVIDKVSNKKHFGAQPILIPSNVMAIHLGKTLSVLYRIESDTLGLMEVRHGRVVNKEKYALPKGILEKGKDVIPFIQHGETVRPPQAGKRMKIYSEPGEIIITKDELLYSGRIKGKTTLVKINTMSREIKTFEIPEDISTKFSTIWHDGYLYKVVKKDEFQVSVYDNDTLVKSFAVNERSSYSQETAYVRDEADKRVFNDRTVWEAIDNMGNPFITVHPVDSNEVVLKLGTNKELTAVGPMGGLHHGPVGLLISLTVSSVVNAVENVFYVHHYFYLKGNPKEGFSYTNDTRLIDQQIDLYELYDQKSKTEYKMKGYLRGNKFVVAFYQLKKATR
ncbi:MAG TPA: hypothetical protein VD884_15235 [Ohtaekwangia sp.]|nr:hypothetical protein [Ohtaekwangia sp.]